MNWLSLSGSPEFLAEESQAPGYDAGGSLLTRKYNVAFEQLTLPSLRRCSDHSSVAFPLELFHNVSRTSSFLCKTT